MIKEIKIILLDILKIIGIIIILLISLYLTLLISVPIFRYIDKNPSILFIMGIIIFILSLGGLFMLLRNYFKDVKKRAKK